MPRCVLLPFDGKGGDDAHAFARKPFVIAAADESAIQTRRFHHERVLCFIAAEARVDARCNAFAQCEIRAAGRVDRHGELGRARDVTRAVRYDFDSIEGAVVRDSIELPLEGRYDFRFHSRGKSLSEAAKRGSCPRSIKNPN